MNKKYIIILILIILAGLFLRIFPFEAKSWISDYDTLVVKEALDIGQSITEKDFSFLQKGVEYPFFIPYILLFFYGLFYFIGILFSFFESSHDFISYLFFNINNLYWHSRILIGIFGALTIPLIYLIINRIFYLSKKNNVALVAVISSCFIAFSLLNVQFSQQIRPHVVVGFFILLSYYCYLISLKKKTLSSFFVLSVVVGLATGIFFTGCFTFIFLILSNYFFFKKDEKFKLLNFIKSIFSFRLFYGLIIVLFFIFIFYPFLFLNSNTERVFISEAEQGIVLSTGGLPFAVTNFGNGFPTILKVFSLHEIGLGLSLILLLIIFLFVKKNKNKENDIYFNYSLIGWLCFVLPYILGFGLLDDGPRYRILIPLIPFVVIGVGVLLVIVINRLKSLNLRKIILFLILVFLLIQFIQTFRLVQLINQPYSRDLASDWIKENISSDKLIVFEEPMPTLIPSKSSLEDKLSFDGNLSRKELFLFSIDPEFYPLDSNKVLDFSLLIDYKGGDVLAALDLLKEIRPDYFVLSSRSIDIDKKGDYPEFKFALEYGSTIKRFSPFKDQELEGSLNFPSGLSNPLIDLWTAKQLGPFVEIYKLDWNNNEK